MKLTIELPDDIGEALNEKWPDLSGYTVELLVVEGYRSGRLTAEQLHRMLSIKTRLEIETFLKERGISVEAWKEQRDNDLRTLQQLSPERSILP